MISSSAVIGKSSIVGVSYRPLQSGNLTEAVDVIVDDGVWIGEYCLIGMGVRIGSDCIIDHYSHIESGAKLGSRVLVIYRGQICADVEVDCDNIIGGFIGERTKIGRRCRVLGNILHHHSDPTRPWDSEGATEPAAVVHDDVFIGFGANITAPISIGPKSYVCAGSVVSTNVPPMHIAAGVNRIIHFREWKGRLAESPIFKE